MYMRLIAIIMVSASTICASSGLASQCAQQDLSIESVGRFPLPTGESGASELSGLAWAGGDLYYAASDATGKVYELRISIDRETGRIERTEFGPSVTLEKVSDVEAIAFNRATDTIWVCDEADSTIREYRAGSGKLIRSIPLARAFPGVRENLGLESLALVDGGRSFWTANEEALAQDGSLAGTKRGSIVRLHRSGLETAPGNGQWVYETEGVGTAFPGLAKQRSGVVELAALPDGRLIVLERAIVGSGPGGIVPMFRSRLYEVDFRGATQIQLIGSLADMSEFVSVGKRLLWEDSFFAINLEGMALGPDLNDGSRVLILIADDGSGLASALYVLKVRD